MLKKFKIGTKIGASFAVSLVSFTVIGLLIYRSATQTIETTRWQTHTYEVLANLENFFSTLKDAETGQRGYLITGSEDYLQPYNAAIPVLETKINQLRRLTVDNPSQQQRLDTVESLTQKRVARLKEVIEIRRTRGSAGLSQIIGNNKGKIIMDDIRAVVSDMSNEELRLLKLRSAAADAATKQMTYSIAFGIPLDLVILTFIAFFLNRNISRPLEKVSQVAEKIAAGDLDTSVATDNRRDEIGMLAQTFNKMIANLRSKNQQTAEQDWLKTNLAKFSRILQGQRNLKTVSQLILKELAPLVSAHHGVFYFMTTHQEQPSLILLGTYAYRERKHLANRFQLGEGLVGQCALEKERILLTEVPSDYIKINSGLGEATPMNIIVLPAMYEERVLAVIELASFQRFSDIHLTFLDQLSESIGIVLDNISAYQRSEELLEQSRSLTEELRSQQEELVQTNQQLEEQTETLQKSDKLLRQQQQDLQQSYEELQQLNEELEEKTELLAQQKQEVEYKNREVEQARLNLEEKATQLATTSKYKSQFLANMSHELRTPLNSLLILAQVLSSNNEGNLTQRQVEYSQTIYSAGNDLLSLINEILDLAKIESGTMEVEVKESFFSELQRYVEWTFRSIAEEKKLDFRVHFNEQLPPAIYTDPKRLQQLLNNLLANAFKFTEQGQVSLQVSVVTEGWSRDQQSLNSAESVIAFAVSDTGIGIPPEKQQVIFEAFQQADGTTSRKYGGTGLGLSISRQIAELLGGEIRLVSQVDLGSTFTLYLPQTYSASVRGQEGLGRVGDKETRRQGDKADKGEFAPPASPTSSSPPSPPSPPLPPSPTPPTPTESAIEDDRQNILCGDRTLLIIEDDLNFARILLDLAREQNFKALVASRGDVGLAMAQEFQPAAIMLDIRLPVMDGWTVLDRLKHDPNTRHIPIHIMTVEEGQKRSLQQGAIAFLQKPITSEALFHALRDIKTFVERKVKNLLVVEDNELQRRSIVELIGNGDVVITAVGTATEALTALNTTHFDCLVLDLGLPDMNGFDLIERIKQQANLNYLPIIIYTGKELTYQEETELRRISDTIIVKDARSPERLLDETSLFLHRLQSNLPIDQQLLLEQLRQSDPVLAGKKILIVDDDIRNIFALTSLLEPYQMEILYAENGRDGITMLQNNPDINIVLMDVMMPGMDGYETMRAIRAVDEFKNLPIIALTAKAMKGDREKCIDAGASDYIPKPVDTEQLLSLLRVWLYR
ncbi:response regulator [Tolypothrix sp. VBCCA 56010]|uniref:response regulator n=1 Tax=Tolypothrix sp. VBCCA 56010 TaxID=3137731 RepID=UPI003D7E849F